MKFNVKILTFVFALALIASCAKEEIIPANQEDNFSKKGSFETIDISTEDGNEDGNEDDEGDIHDVLGGGNGNGDITDPENDLDFD